MKTKRKALMVVWLLLFAFGITACAPQQPAETTEAAKETSAPTTEAPKTTADQEETTAQPEESKPLSREDVIREERDYLAQMAKDNASEVRTLPGGVQVKRTPDTSDTQVNCIAPMSEFMSYNNFWLNADRRGCGACHTDLAETVMGMKSYPHVYLNAGIHELDYTIQTCLDCHDKSTGLYDEPEGSLGSAIHTIHSSKNEMFQNMNGDCRSCHYATEDGAGLQLWDQVKHQVLRGISGIPAEELEYTFDWNQDKVLSADQMFDVTWYFRDGGVQRWAAGQIDLKPEPATDGVYDQWQIAITGDVENPMTLSLSEMMELVPMDTDIATLHCGINPIGGGLIGNYEIKGISVKKLLEHAGVKDSATLLQVFDKEGYEYVIGLDTIAEKGCYLVLEVGGEPISYAQGYPVQFWPGGEAAWKATKEVTELRVLSVPVDSDEYAERNFPTGFPENKPCVAIFHLAEGQIIPADQPYTFEGFAHAWENQITGIEVSFDQGQTWARCETPDASVERWVYWNFTWTPPQAGAYTITVRAVMEGDVVSPATVEYLVNAE